MDYLFFFIKKLPRFSQELKFALDYENHLSVLPLRVDDTYPPEPPGVDVAGWVAAWGLLQHLVLTKWVYMGIPIYI